MDIAIQKVNELIAIDMGSLVEDKKDARRERVRAIANLLGVTREPTTMRV